MIQKYLKGEYIYKVSALYDKFGDNFRRVKKWYSFG